MSNYIERQADLLGKKFGKTELVAHLKKQVSDKDIEIGKLKAFIDEQNYLINDLTTKLSICKEVTIKYKQENKNLSKQAKLQLKTDSLYLKLKESNKALQQKNLELIKFRDKVIANERTKTQ